MTQLGEVRETIKKIGWVYKNGNPVGSREWHIRQAHIVKHAEKEVETLLATTTKQAVEECIKLLVETIVAQSLEANLLRGDGANGVEPTAEDYRKIINAYEKKLSHLLKEEGE